MIMYLKNSCKISRIEKWALQLEFSTTSVIKFEFAKCIVTSNVLTVMNKNHERCIFPILPVYVPRSYWNATYFRPLKNILKPITTHKTIQSTLRPIWHSWSLPCNFYHNYSTYGNLTLWSFMIHTSRQQ